MTTNTSEKIKIDFRKIDPKEPEWLYRLRQSGWNNYIDMPLPERTIPLWRYTQPESFLISGAENAMNFLPVSPNGKKPESELFDPEMAGYGFNQADFSTYALLGPDLLKSGIIFKELSSAIRENAALTEPYFGKLIPADFGKFEAANMALWSTGLFLYIPDNVVIEKPIYLHRNPTGAITATRLLVVLGKNADVTIIDDHNCRDSHENDTANNAIEIFADDFSRVKYFGIQRLGPKAKTYTTQRIRVGCQAQSVSIFASLGAALAKVNAGTILAEKGAESKIYGVAFGDQNQQFDHYTFHHHASANTLSNIDFKVVLKQKALSAYTGLIRIENDAPNCEAYQENRNLLLNKGARAESIPELEILNDQVRCTHGATVGQIDPEMVFYLKSRGFSTADAIKTLVTGFVEPTINKMPKYLGHIIREMIKVKLEGGYDAK